MSETEPSNPVDPDRRNVLQAAGAAMVVGMAMSGAATASAQTAAAAPQRSTPLGARL